MAIDAYTKLLLHCNGVDASTTFTDSELTPKTVTAYDNAQIDTAQSKFGGASGFFDGTGDYLTVPDSDDWAFGTGDFTIDWWVRFVTTAVSHSFFSQKTDTNNRYILYFNNNTIYWSQLVGGSGGNNIAKAWTPSIDTWYHVALVKASGVYTFYIDGASIGSNTENTSIANLTGNLEICRDTDSGSNFFNGWLDEIRISKGIARWTANFTPPTRAYGIGSGGGFLFNYL